MVSINKDHCIFSVWAPEKEKMLLHIINPVEQEWEMEKDNEGYFHIETDSHPLTLYYFKLENKDYPDPASDYQPEGVHGPSQVIDHNAYKWKDAHWKGVSIEDLILYEIHVGTFTEEGTFEAIIPRLDELNQSGINAIELMPVAQFPGNRNWGYDGVYPYAVQNSYGGPEGLKKLVDACHEKNMAVILDVVYNHLGPEGNYLDRFGPYFTGQYKTPWGQAINFDGEWSDGVREYFSENPLHWFKKYHIDGLRIDAIHTIYDNGAVHFWELTNRKIKQLEEQSGKRFLMIAESDFNSPRVVKPIEQGGFGFDAQWLDDFHHALYVLLDEKGKERYYDFGTMEQLAKAYNEGFVHSGEFVLFRKRKHGVSSAALPGNKFIVFNQNHDQIGNRVNGERLCMLVDFERQKLAAASIMLSPYIPMLFMGEEYADDSPFYYFVSHSDHDLIQAVQKGRKKEFEGYKWSSEPPDPQNVETFDQSKIKWQNRNIGKHKIILEWHKELIRLRSNQPALKDFDKKNVLAKPIGQKGLILFRQAGNKGQRMICLFNFSEKSLPFSFTVNGSEFKKELDSKQARWMENTYKGELLPELIGTDKDLIIPGCSATIYISY